MYLLPKGDTKGSCSLCFGVKIDEFYIYLAFEYSDVEASIKGSIVSVKNPKSGTIIADEIKEIILTEDKKYPSLANIKIREKVHS